MAAVAAGEERALAALVERHSRRVHAYLVRRLGSVADADDVLQDTWLRVARHAREFDRSRRFLPWLYGIATNRARDLFRREAVRLRARDGAPDERAGEGSRVDDHVELRERVQHLPERHREVLLLRYFVGLGEAEMAETLKIPPGTVKSRLHTAIRMLREQYESTPRASGAES